MKIEQCGPIDAAAFRERFIEKRQPVLVRGAIAAWPALANWSLSHFRDRHGQRQVTCRGESAPVALADYIDSLGDSTFERPAPYLRNLNIQTDWPELVADVSPAVAYARPDWLSSWLMPRDWPRPRHLNQLFLSGKGTRISLHYDDWMTHNIVSNIIGEKQFMLFAPDQGPLLYPRQDDYLVSRIPNPWDVEPDVFPDFSRARPILVTVGPGESLFVPCGWWHTTRTLSTCLSVSSSFAGRDNWDDMVDEVRFMRTFHGGSPWKTRLLCAYLTGVGLALTTAASVQHARRAHIPARRSRYAP